MVKAPVQSSVSPSQQKPARPTTATVFHQHHYSTSGSNSNSKKNRHMATESPGEVLTTVPVVASCGPGTSSGTLVVTTMAVNVTGASAVSVPPIVVAMAPSTHASQNPGGLIKQGTQNTNNAQRNTATPFVYHALPVQIPATAAAAAAQAGTWPIVEPVFHFGPGFEPRQLAPSVSVTQSTNSEHVVLFHVSPGVSVTFQVGGGKHEVVRGPVTVPMVSQSGSPPIPMPVQVPPGHVMQQIVDENGTLRHVILSTAQPQHMQQQSGVQPHLHAAPFITANGTASYYSPLQAGYPNPAQHFHPGMPGTGGHLQPQPTMSHSPHSPSPPNSNYHKDERSQRQHAKLVRKLDNKKSRDMNSTVSSPNQSPSPRKNELNGVSLVRRHQRSNGTSSVGTSEDGEESSSVPDEEDDAQAIIEQLSSIQAPIVNELSPRSALLQWVMPASSDNVTLNFNDLEFEILLADRGKDGRYKQLFKGQSLSCRIQDLSPGKEYACILQVYFGDQHCFASDPVVFSTPRCEPNAPTDIKLHARTKNSLHLKWNAPADNGAPILNYILECDHGKNGEFVEISRTKYKTYNYNKLAPSTAYNFRLTAVNEVGRSQYSPIARYETATNPPAQPYPPYLQNATSSSLRLAWQRRPTDEEFTLQMVEYGQQGYFNVYDGPDTTYDCNGLNRATAFQFRLRTKNEAGVSQWSEDVLFKTLPECPSRPAKPQVKGKIHATNFRVRWEPPTDRGGAEIKTYYLEISSGAGFEAVYVGSETEAVCDRLSPGTTYQLRVICEGPAGSSGYSDYSTVTTEPVVPGPPPTPYLANQPGPYACVLRWDKSDYNGGAPVISYEVEVEGGPQHSRVQAYSGKEMYCVVKDLLPGENYSVQVRALNRIGAGPWSDMLNIKTTAAPPHTPAPPTINVRSATQLTVAWCEPCTNGAAITEYRLEYSQTEAHDGFTVAYQGPQITSDVKNLTPATLYFFRLCAANHAGTSPYSQLARQQTPPAPPAVPVFGVYEKSACDIRLTWDAPDPNGTPILYYNVECGDRLVSTSDASTELLIDQLSAETTYKVRIQAVNKVGTGLFSNYIKITTLPLPPRPPRLECCQVSFNFLKLRWAEEKSKNTGQLDLVRYHVEMQNNRTKEFINVYSGTRNTCKVNKLHELQEYRFRIYAETDSAGQGDYSEEFVFTTPAAIPNSIKAPRVAISLPAAADTTTSKDCVDGGAAAASEMSGASTELAQLPLEWQQSKNNAFNDRIEYLLEMCKAKCEQEFKEVYHGLDTRHTLTNLEFDVEYQFRVCPIRVMASTAERVPGPYSTVMYHTITQPEEKEELVDGDTMSTGVLAGNNGGSSRFDATHGVSHTGGVSHKFNQNILVKMLDHVLSVYRNRDRFTDQQKALICVIVLMVAALMCAAMVEMFVR